jgi:hypothetical protein
MPPLLHCLIDPSSVAGRPGLADGAPGPISSRKCAVVHKVEETVDCRSNIRSSLLPRCSEGTGGRIMVKGIDIRRFTLSPLRRGDYVIDYHHF